MPKTRLLISTARFSPCEQFRYELHRRWDYDGVEAMFIGLNPSTADATKNDPTVRRCMDFAKRWGFAGMKMTNIFAFRSTQPTVLYDRIASVLPIVGAENDEHLKRIAMSSGRIICCWGTHGGLLGRDMAVVKLLRSLPVMLQCLGKNSGGSPKHPLYIRADKRPEVFQ